MNRFDFTPDRYMRTEVFELIRCKGKWAGGNSFRGLYGEAPPERGTVFRL